MSTLLESYGPIFFSAVQNRFHCCSLLLFKLPAVLGEVTRTPDCPHSLTLKPCEHLAGTVLVPQPTAAEPQALVSVQRRQRHPMPRRHGMPGRSWEQPNLQPGHTRIISELSTTRHKQQPRPAFTTTFSNCHP